MKEPSDTHEFYDPESQKRVREYADFDTWLERQNADFERDTISEVDDIAIHDILHSALLDKPVSNDTRKQLESALERWYEKAKRNEDDDVFEDNGEYPDHY